MNAPVWHLLTGEYPPHGGGIADYTALLARALADAGRDVHVWTPAPVEPSSAGGVTVHAMDGFTGGALSRLGAELDRFAAPRRLLVQYAPQAWGLRGMNVPFCRWLLARRRARDDVRVMFHEPFFPFGWQRPRRNLLAAVNRWMARLLLRASTRAYVSIRAWEKLLRPLAPRGLEFTLLPIPSTIPFVDDPGRVAAIRRELSEDGRRPVFVHFGTYGGMIAPMLKTALRALIARRPDARILLLGRDGPGFSHRLCATDARFADALVAPGYLPPEDVSLHLQASDVALQPYPDGADTRRTTLMACVANGVPTVTTRGRFTDGEVMLSVAGYPAASEPHRMGEIAALVLEDPTITRIGEGGHASLRQGTREFYLRHFAIEHTVARLLADEGGG
ncbi:MAG: glycosyltransferase [Gemmatimonadetes bacterium]|nr:glycosyltransferase [Gemmatimonadota bacterium]